MLIPGWEPGELSCLACGYERYPRALGQEIAVAEVAADERRRVLHHARRGTAART